MDNEMIDLIIKCTFAVVSVLLTGYLIPWFRTFIGQAKMDSLNEFVEQCVRAAEKLYIPEEKKEKKAYVYQLAVDKLGELGISISSEMLDAIIESAVKELKG